MDAEDVSTVVNHAEKPYGNRMVCRNIHSNFFFLDTFYNRQYQADQQLKTLITLFTILSIAIACIGLFGLTLYTTQQRKKEIGIRKILGASTFGLTFHILKDFLILVAISFALGIPLAVYMMNSWLDRSYTYRIELSMLEHSMLSGGILLLFALISMLAQTLWASNSNPVDCIRTE